MSQEEPQNNTTKKLMGNKQQTSIDWLKKQLETYGNPSYCEVEWSMLDKLTVQAKEIDKQQKIDAYYQGEFNQGCNGSAVDYYRETYE